MAPPENPNGAGPAAPSDPAQPQPQPPAKSKWKKKDEKKDDDLSEEDLALKEQLELYVVRAQDADPGVQKLALESMRNLAGEIAQEFQKRQDDDMPIDALMELVQQIVSFHMKHNAEPEAVDLLMEVEDLDLLVEHVDSTNYKRTCLYLTSSSKYLPAPDDMLALDIAYTIYMKFEDLTSALRIALLLDNKSMQYVKQVYTATEDLQLKKQFSFIIARHGLAMEIDDEIAADGNDKEGLQEIVNNSKLSEGYLTLARDIEVMEAKSPEDIYKVHLIDGRGASSSLDSARQNLAATFVNAFVNAGFGQDKLMTAPSDSSSSGASGNWLFKNKEHGKASAAASLGMILLWDTDSGLAQLDKYLHSNDAHVVAGALLGIGIVTCGVKNDCDPALAILMEYINKDDTNIRIGAILGLGIAYAGSQKEELKSYLSTVLGDSEKSTLEVLIFSAIALGLVFVGSCNEEIAQSIIFALMERSEAELAEPIIRLLPVALGLLYLGKQESVEATAEVSKTFDEKIRKYCDVTLMSLAYAGTGNVLKVQKLLGICSQHLEKGETHQGPAVLGIALIAMAEELGAEMAVRSLERLLQYGEQNIRRAVPLALGILCISNPKVNVMDTLSRLSHDADADVSMAAIISLGLIGAGTNNARIAGMLRNLSSYYYKEAAHLFCVRIAQGLVHLGKGLLTLSPYHSDRFLLSPMALGGLVTVLHACLDMKSTILGKYHYILYIIVLAMQPRMLLTVDEDLKPLSVPVRVGQAVDVVGQAGRPKTITGFQTHSTPVLLAAGERAELATEKYIPLTSVLEGFVILKKNPEYNEERGILGNHAATWDRIFAYWVPSSAPPGVNRIGLLSLLPESRVLEQSSLNSEILFGCAMTDVTYHLYPNMGI
uniref:26S proteasome non-ATPase regulatory subunit 2 homolog n=1 Tax=Oryza nivara TaxID=4536 RepID=A0A0E0G163_ORYNI